MPPEVQQNNENLKSNPAESKKLALGPEMTRYNESLRKMGNGETKFSLNLKTQNETLKALIPTLEAGIQKKMCDLAQEAIRDQNSFDKNMDGFLKENILFSEDFFKLQTTSGTLSLGEMGDSTTVSFTSNEGLSFQAAVDGLNLTKVRAVYNQNPNSEIGLGYDLSNNTLEASYAKKWKSKDYDAALGIRAFHENDSGNTGVNLGFTISF